jgi:hypothetical protein
MGRRLSGGAIAAAAVLVVAGCGSATPSSSGSTTASATPRDTASAAPTQGGGCAGDPAAFSTGKKLAGVDVDGDGRADEVRLTAASGECQGRVVAKLVDGYAGAALPSTPTSAFGVRLPGHRGSLLVTRQDNPRGGYQLRVYALASGELAELVDGQQPLVPFVATDTRPVSTSVDCRGSTIAVSQAVAAPGGRWSIHRTTYAVHGSAATRTGTAVVADDLSAERVDRLMPAGAAVFPSCGGQGSRSGR